MEWKQNPLCFCVFYLMYTPGTKEDNADNKITLAKYIWG